MDDLSLLDDLVSRAKAAGADQADALLSQGASLSHAQRLGRTEKLERSEHFDLGLRVLIGKRQAIVSANERDPAAFPELVARAIDMAKAVPEDPYVGLAAPDELARNWPDLDLLDPVEPAPDDPDRACESRRRCGARRAGRYQFGRAPSEVGAEGGWLFSPRMASRRPMKDQVTMSAFP